MAQELFTTPLFSDANLVAYYRAENTSDSKDSNTLTNNGTVTFDPAMFNNGFDLGASNTTKYMSLASDLGMDIGAGAYSFSLWIKFLTAPTNGGPAMRMISLSSQTGTKNISSMDYFNNGGTLQVNFGSGTGTDTHYNFDLGLTDFHYIVGTCDSSGNLISYVDGAQVATGSRTAFDIGAATLRIGASHSAANFASAIIDDVAVFNRVLTSTEVFKLFTGFSAPEVENGQTYYSALAQNTYHRISRDIQIRIKRIMEQIDVGFKKLPSGLFIPSRLYYRGI